MKLSANLGILYSELPMTGQRQSSTAERPDFALTNYCRGTIGVAQVTAFEVS